MDDALILLVALGASLGLWTWSITGRDRVIAISAKICRELRMQRLDDSVTLRAVRLVCEPRLALERHYEFEFSANGLDRRRGSVVLHGSVLVRASLQMPDGTLELDPSQLPAPG
jgi:hypothetical protein